MSPPGFVVWFTGLSGSGKSTLAAMLGAELARRGLHVERLDGDEVRQYLSKGLGFSRDDRDTNIRRIGFVAKLIARSGACAITAAISPYREVRDEQRRAIGRFCEVYTACPVEALALRDAKGLYRKALAGEIKNFTGVDDPYEPPIAPEVICRTDLETQEESLAKIVAKLEQLGLVAPDRAGRAHSTGLPPPHGGELVDCQLRGAERDRMLEQAQSLPCITLDERAACDLELIAGGAYSPLRGFMSSKDYLKVLREVRLETGLVWPLPVTLSLSAEGARAVAIGKPIALATRDGRRVGVLEVSDKFAPNPELEAAALPTVAPPASVYVGGEVKLLDRPLDPALFAYLSDPSRTRTLFEQRGWARVVGLPSRSLPHRGHEYIAKCALETTDGLLFSALVAPGDDGPWPVSLRVRCFESLIRGYFPPDRVSLAALAGWRRGAGPREVLFCALVHKNHGCSHFAFGPGADMGTHRTADAARRMFDAFGASEIGVVPLPFDEVYYSKSLGTMASSKTDLPARTDGDRLRISHRTIDEMLERGERPPPEMMRPEVSALLMEARRDGGST